MSRWTAALRTLAIALAGAGLTLVTVRSVEADTAPPAPLVVRSPCSYPVRLVAMSRRGQPTTLIAREPGVYRFASPRLHDAASVASGTQRRPVQEFPVDVDGALLVPQAFCVPLRGGAGLAGGPLGSR